MRERLVFGSQSGGRDVRNHKAAVVGDMVGDPFKDTSGPSLNILLKLMSVVALVIAPLLVPDKLPVNTENSKPKIESVTPVAVKTPAQ